MSVDLNIVLIGNVSRGKSSLINALLGKEIAKVEARGGSTQDVKKYLLDHTYSLKDGSLNLNILDTPGLAEVDGKKRADVAVNAAQKGDLLLFIINNDLTDNEFQVIQQLDKFNKPVILIFNQSDKYDEIQRADIRKSLEKRLINLIEPINILFVSASPLQKIVIQKVTGEEEVVEREGLPDVLELKNRIIGIANELGKHIEEISDCVEQLVGEYQKIEAKKNHLQQLKNKATDKCFNYAVGIGAGTAINPAPLFDLIGGAAGVGVLVKEIAQIHGEHISMDEAKKMAKEMLIGFTTLSCFTLIGIGLGTLVKMIPFVGWIVGGAAQTVLIAFAVYIMGDSLNDYYANNKQWSIDNSLRKSIEEKIRVTDRDKIMRRLKEGINKKLGKSS